MGVPHRQHARCTLTRYDLPAPQRRVVAEGCPHLRVPASGRSPDPVRARWRLADRAVGHECRWHRQAPAAPGWVGPGGGAISGCAAYSPDGRPIAFGFEWTQRHARIHVMNADGTGLRRLNHIREHRRQRPCLVAGRNPDRLQPVAGEPDHTGLGHPADRRRVGRWRSGHLSRADAGPDGALFDFSPDGTTILSLPGTLAGAFDQSPRRCPPSRSIPRAARREKSAGT